jgi:tRNA A-37 threonylcarbamoyl transferase component Bud32
MTSLVHQHCQGFFLGSRQTLSDHQLQQLCTLFQSPPSASSDTLAGRQGVALADMPGIGQVVVKHYARGGLIRHINTDTYVNVFKTRGEKEFLWLEIVRRIGIKAPTPVAFAATGRWVGQCWLVTTVVPKHRSLIQFSRDNDDRRERVYRHAGEQVRTLIRHGIWHRDLHPGNVLVSDQNVPFLIDFDKACHVRNRQRLHRRYVARWRRAVVKHGLPDELNAVMAFASSANDASDGMEGL